MAKQPTPKKPVTKKSEPMKGPSIKQKEKPFKFNPEPRTSGTKSKAINLPSKPAPKPSDKFMSKKIR